MSSINLTAIEPYKKRGKVPFKEAAKVLDLSEGTVKHYTTKGKLKRAGFGFVWYQSLIDFLNEKESDNKLKVNNKTFLDLWVEIKELKKNLNLLMELYNEYQEELTLTKEEGEALIKSAQRLDFSEQESLKNWAKLCNKITLKNLLFLCEINNMAWFYLYDLCLYGKEYSNQKRKTEELIIYNKALKNIHELCILYSMVKRVHLRFPRTSTIKKRKKK